MSLSTADIENLSRLLHRIGLFVSSSDDRGFWANKVEEKVFRQSLEKCSQDKAYPDVVRQIAEAALTYKADDDLAAGLDNVPAECEGAVKKLNAALDQDSVTGFKDTVMNIAFAVSDANWEVEKGEVTAFDFLWNILPLGRVLIVFDGLKDFVNDLLRNSNVLSRKLNASYQRISFDEDSAIAKIVVALRKDVEEQSVPEFLNKEAS